MLIGISFKIYRGPKVIHLLHLINLASLVFWRLSFRWFPTGSKRLYRYRFLNPLMQPFVIMQGIQSERIESGVSTNRLCECSRRYRAGIVAAAGSSIYIAGWWPTVPTPERRLWPSWARSRRSAYEDVPWLARRGSVTLLERLDGRQCNRREVNHCAQDPVNPEHTEHEAEELAEGRRMRPDTREGK